MKINKKFAGIIIVGALFISLIYIAEIYVTDGDSQLRECIIDLPDMDAVPEISKDQAIETVEDFLESEAIKRLGYERCKILELKLTIAKPNYDSERNVWLTPKGEPTLVWYMCIRDRHGWRIDVIVDAQNGYIVGLLCYK